MTTETASQLLPCPLPDCEEGEHHYHDMDCYTVDETHDCARVARIGYRCYSQHRPGLPAPLDLPEITDEMVGRAVVTYVNTYYAATDARRGEHGMRAALTEFRHALFAGIPQWQEVEPGTHIGTGTRYRIERPSEAFEEVEDGYTDWSEVTDCRVFIDPRSVDPDADLIEKLAGLLDLTDLNDAREVIATVRAHDEAGEQA